MSWVNLHISPLGTQGVYLPEPSLVRALLQLGSILPRSLNIQGEQLRVLQLPRSSRVVTEIPVLLDKLCHVNWPKPGSLGPEWVQEPTPSHSCFRKGTLISVSSPAFVITFIFSISLQKR